MRNIEIKAKCGDLQAARAVCERLGAVFTWDDRQVDTYFRIPGRRLKLRQSGLRPPELVLYSRPDDAEVRACDYEVVELQRAEPIKTHLSEDMGVLIVVEKQRTLYMLDHVRIHLDRVAGLGDYVEFEAVLDEEMDEAEEHRRVQGLLAEFRLAESDLCALSYSDLLLAG